MRELAAVLKKADTMAPLTALKVLGELECMDELEELEAELQGDIEASLEKAEGEAGRRCGEVPGVAVADGEAMAVVLRVVRHRGDGRADARAHPALYGVHVQVPPAEQPLGWQ